MINNLASLVYNKGLREQIKEYWKEKYEQRINYLVGANNELMSELEQYERVRKIDELSPDEITT
jgi:hypothetical protein